jgi:hypothetical protein
MKKLLLVLLFIFGSNSFGSSADRVVYGVLLLEADLILRVGINRAYQDMIGGEFFRGKAEAYQEILDLIKKVNEN